MHIPFQYRHQLKLYEFMTDQLVILAGGASSRMKNSSFPTLSKESIHQANSRSKALITINNRPMLDYVLFNAKQAGFKKIYLVTEIENELFKEYYGTKESNNAYQGLSISYAYQFTPKGRNKPLGTADAVCQALDQYSELREQKFVVCNCDNLYSSEAFSLLRRSNASNAFINYDRDALQYSQDRIESFALTKTDASNFLLDIIEKPTPETAQHYQDVNGKLRVSMNVFLFDGTMIYPFLKNCIVHPTRNEKELPSALLQMITNHPKAMIGIPLSEHVPDLTSKSDILKMIEYLVSHQFYLDWTKMN